MEIKNKIKIYFVLFCKSVTYLNLEKKIFNFEATKLFKLNVYFVCKTAKDKQIMVIFITCSLYQNNSTENYIWLLTNDEAQFCRLLISLIKWRNRKKWKKSIAMTAIKIILFSRLVCQEKSTDLNEKKTITLFFLSNFFLV